MAGTRITIASESGEAALAATPAARMAVRRAVSRFRKSRAQVQRFVASFESIALAHHAQTTLGNQALSEPPRASAARASARPARRREFPERPRARPLRFRL